MSTLPLERNSAARRRTRAEVLSASAALQVRASELRASATAAAAAAAKMHEQGPVVAAQVDAASPTSSPQARAQAHADCPFKTNEVFDLDDDKSDATVLVPATPSSRSPTPSPSSSREEPMCEQPSYASEKRVWCTADGQVVGGEGGLYNKLQVPPELQLEAVGRALQVWDGVCWLDETEPMLLRIGAGARLEPADGCFRREVWHVVLPPYFIEPSTSFMRPPRYVVTEVDGPKPPMPMDSPPNSPPGSPGAPSPPETEEEDTEFEDSADTSPEQDSEEESTWPDDAYGLSVVRYQIKVIGGAWVVGSPETPLPAGAVARWVVKQPDGTWLPFPPVQRGSPRASPEPSPSASPPHSIVSPSASPPPSPGPPSPPSGSPSGSDAGSDAAEPEFEQWPDEPPPVADWRPVVRQLAVRLAVRESTRALLRPLAVRPGQEPEPAAQLDYEAEPIVVKLGPNGVWSRKLTDCTWHTLSAHPLISLPGKRYLMDPEDFPPATELEPPEEQPVSLPPSRPATPAPAARPSTPPGLINPHRQVDPVLASCCCAARSGPGWNPGPGWGPDYRSQPPVWAPGPFTSVDTAFTWDSPGRSSPWNARAVAMQQIEPPPTAPAEPLEYSELPGTPLAEVDLAQEALNTELLDYANNPFGAWAGVLWDSAAALTLRVWLSAEPWPAEQAAAFLSEEFLCRQA